MAVPPSDPAKSNGSGSTFEQLLEAAPDAIVGVDDEGKIVLVNSQTEALFGYPRDHLLGQAVEVLVPDRIIQSQVELAVETVLSKERRAALAAERQRMEEKSRQAHVLALAAAVDEAMLLSDDQLERLSDYLYDNWRPVWGQVSASQLSAPRATPLQSAALGSAPAAIRAAMVAAWARGFQVSEPGEPTAAACSGSAPRRFRARRSAPAATSCWANSFQ